MENERQSGTRIAVRLHFGLQNIIKCEVAAGQKKIILTTRTVKAVKHGCIDRTYARKFSRHARIGRRQPATNIRRPSGLLRRVQPVAVYAKRGTIAVKHLHRLHTVQRFQRQPAGLQHAKPIIRLIPNERFIPVIALRAEPKGKNGKNRHQPESDDANRQRHLRNGEGAHTAPVSPDVHGHGSIR